MHKSIWTPNSRRSVVVTHKRLVTLRGAPIKVEGNFNCTDNKLETLEHGPQTVNKDFNCSRNRLTSLQYAPSFVGRNFLCARNNLTSLKNVHKYVKYIGGTFYCYGNDIQDSILGLCLIQGIVDVVAEPYGQLAHAVAIINNELEAHDDPSERMLIVQDKLIDAGFECFARL